MMQTISKAMDRNKREIMANILSSFFIPFQPTVKSLRVAKNINPTKRIIPKMPFIEINRSAFNRIILYSKF